MCASTAVACTGAVGGHLLCTAHVVVLENDLCLQLLLSNDASPFEMNAQMRITLDEATAGDHAEVATAIRLIGEEKVKANQEKRYVPRATI